MINNSAQVLQPRAYRRWNSGEPKINPATIALFAFPSFNCFTIVA